MPDSHPGGRVPLLCILLPAVALTASCRDHGIVPASAVMHPTPENLPAPGGPLIRADTMLVGVSDPQRAAEWTAARRALLDAEVVTSIGTLSGDGPDVLGVVGDAEVDEEGNVYIQDNTTEELLIFNSSGDFLHQVGGKGDGPNEFRGIRRFIRLPDGRLLVGHEGGPVKVLKLGAEGYEYAGPLLPDWTTEPVAVRDMCAVRDRIFIHSTNLGEGARVIREVSPEEGRVVASFADGYRSEFAWDRQRRSFGSIACGDGPVTLVWSLYYFPIVKAYRPDNTLLWTALIEDFGQGLIYQNDAASRTVHLQGLPVEYIVASHALGSGFVVLQTVLYGARGVGESAPVVGRRTYLIDQETGNGGLVSENLPWIAWIGDKSFVTVPADPYPKVEVRSFLP